MSNHFSAPFEGSWHRFDRATTHRESASAEWNAFLDSDPYDVLLYVDDEGNGTLTIQQVAPVPPIIGVLFGEYFYNLRTALDYLVYDVAIHDSDANPPPRADSLQFPIYSNPDTWSRNEYRIDPLSEKHRGWLKDIQPCFRSDGHPEWDGLYWLNELARLDRHRQLHVVGGYITESAPLIDAPHATAVLFEDVDPYVFVEDDTEIARFKVVPHTRYDKVEGNPQTAIDIEIREWARMRPTNLAWTKWTLRIRCLVVEAYVDAVIGRFERDCTGRTRAKYLRDDTDIDGPT